MRAVVVLFDDDQTAAAVAAVIADLVRSDTAVVLLPPVRGTAFFADEAAAAQVDRWWAENVPGDAFPLYVMDFTPAVLPWIEGVDGVFLLRGAPEIIGSRAVERVTAVHGDTPLDVAAGVVDELGTGGEAAADDIAVPDFADLLGRDAGVAERDRDADTMPIMNPFDVLTAASPPMADASPPPGVAGRSLGSPYQASSAHEYNGRVRRSVTSMLRLPAWRGRVGSVEGKESDIELASALARRGSTVVAVGSRKGGVGKTSHAAGMAIVAGSLLDAIGHRAVIVDANVANPDAWGVLNLPPGAATVRDTIAALAANLDPPRPVHATTPALACYPEAREASEYSRFDIDLLATHLRRGYTLAVIDLSNRLPDPTGGAEAAAAAYWLEHADAVVLPTAWSKQDFNGVLDYLELPELPPAVVAYISPRARRHREHPLTQRYMDAIAQRARRIVELPDEADNVRYAGMAGVPLDSVSRTLRAGYRALTAAVTEAVGSRVG